MMMSSAGLSKFESFYIMIRISGFIDLESGSRRPSFAVLIMFGPFAFDDPFASFVHNFR